MVFRKPICDCRRVALADRATRGGAVPAAKTHRRAVVVELVELHAEALAHGQGHLGEQRRAVGIEQVVQGAAQPVVAQVLHVMGADAEHRAGKAVHCLLLAVDGLALHDQ